MNFFFKLFSGFQNKYLKSFEKKVQRINVLEKELEKLDDETIKKRFLSLKEKVLEKKIDLDEALEESFALTREAAKRTLGQRYFDVQLMGGIALHEGKIIEMKTGEGKTLVATLPAVLNAMTKKGVHIVTVNDYLARRDTVWMGKIYNFLGLSVGCITQNEAYLFDPSHQKTIDDKEKTTINFKVDYEFLKPCSRKEAYETDITYGTNNTFGFDYLKDNLVQNFQEIVQRPYYYAIIDEVDSILIDEARTPLIISAPDRESTQMYKKFASIVPFLKKDIDYKVDEKFHAVTLTDEGIKKVEELLNDSGIYKRGDIEKIFHLEQALKAHCLFHKDKDYIVKDGQVIIIDEFTGRLMPDRRYSEGIHQAIEAKEGVLVREESKTLATITFQNLFRKYPKIAGMTGTALTSAEEFYKVYKLETVAIPPNKKIIRIDYPDRIYKTMMGKFKAVVKEIKEAYVKGQPVLVGTISIEKNELLSAMLKKEGIPHNVLNAKNHEKEAEIIAQAGKLHAVTVATNMAGRGVDIILGGNPSDEIEKEKVKALGGLYVIGTERHEARRIDNQLRGRSGRQGDPGQSRFFVSLEDDLMRIFGPEKLKKMMDTFRIPEDMPIENKFVSNALESAQSKIEGFNFDIRKYVLEFDEVLNKQREAIYRQRRQILEKFFYGESLKDDLFEVFLTEIKEIISFYNFDEPTFNIEEIAKEIYSLIGIQIQVSNLKSMDKKEAIEEIFKQVKNSFIKKFLNFEDKIVENIIKSIWLNTIDVLWMAHLDAMEHLREGVRLRAYGQQDPLVEYKREGLKMFAELNSNIRQQFISALFKVGDKVQQNQTTQKEIIFGFDNSLLKQNKSTTEIPLKARLTPLGENKYQGVGRNDPCPCGSGKKFKRCHGA